MASRAVFCCGLRLCSILLFLAISTAGQTTAQATTSTQTPVQPPAGSATPMAGTHGFFHTNFGSHTEALGVMKNFNLPKTKVVTGYTWVQAGLTSFTGYAHVKNRFYDGEALGGVIHFNDHSSVWIQESYNKIPTVPWYTTTGIDYTWSR